MNHIKVHTFIDITGLKVYTITNLNKNEKEKKMKLLNEDSKKITNHLNAILRQDWSKSKKLNRLLKTCKSYCIEYPESSYEIAGIYGKAKRSI